jgi:diadenylate cyclase
MLNDLWQYLQARTWTDLARDVLDVLITYYIFYRVTLVLKGTRAMQILFGVAGVFLLYVIAQLLRLNTVLTILSAVLSSAILIGVVVFQNDIRRGLMRVGGRARLSAGQTLESKLIDDVVEAAQILAKHRTGAIITLEQEANLDEFVGSHQGHLIDATVTPELLVSLFIPDALNKLHDGAVILRDLRVAKAGVFFPMPEGRVADESFGSRHRAAMGITEETDAVVVVVSEERGSISFCFNGNIIANLDGPRLRAALDGIFAPKRTATTKPQSWLSVLRKRTTQSPASSRLPLERHTGPLSTRTPLRRKIEENTRAHSSGERSNKPLAPKPPVGQHQAVEPLRKRVKGGDPHEPKSDFGFDSSLSPTATPIRTRAPVPTDEERVSLLAEVPLLPAKRPRDSVPPPDPSKVLGTPLPQSRSGNPAAPDMPLRHLNRPATSNANGVLDGTDGTGEHVIDSSRLPQPLSDRAATPHAEPDCNEVPTTARVRQGAEPESDNPTLDHQEPAP